MGWGIGDHTAVDQLFLLLRQLHQPHAHPRLDVMDHEPEDPVIHAPQTCAKIRGQIDRQLWIHAQESEEIRALKSTQNAVRVRRNCN